MVFRHLVGGRPDVVAGEIDVLPAERRQMGEKVIGNVLGLAQGGDRAVQITGVPQGDGRDEKVEAGSAVLLVFVGAVADFAETMNEDGARQAVARFALVELAARAARSSGSSIQSSVNRVRSSRPSSRSAAATPFCRG